jgi:hypothetical protein
LQKNVPKLFAKHGGYAFLQGKRCCGSMVVDTVMGSIRERVLLYTMITILNYTYHQSNGTNSFQDQASATTGTQDGATTIHHLYSALYCLIGHQKEGASPTRRFLQGNIVLRVVF